MQKQKKKSKTIFFFIYLTLKNRLDIVYVRVKSPWMQKQNKRANERSAASEWAQRSERMSAAERGSKAIEWVMRANERADKRMIEYSTRRFRII